MVEGERPNVKGNDKSAIPKEPNMATAAAPTTIQKNEEEASTAVAAAATTPSAGSQDNEVPDRGESSLPNLDTAEQNEDANSVAVGATDTDVEQEEGEYTPAPGAERVDAEGFLQEEEDGELVGVEDAIPIARPVNIEDEQRRAWLGDNIAVAVRDSTLSDHDHESKTWRGKLRKHRKCVIFLILGAVGAAIAAVVVVTTSSDGDSQAPAPTTREDSATPTAAPTTSAPTTAAYGDLLVGVFEDYDIQPRSPQSQALSWLANVDTLQNLSDDRLRQRFALATLYYSTSGKTAWENQLNFLTDEHECEWKDVIGGTVLGVALCDDNDMVTELNFANNKLDGPLPSEIGNFTALKKFNFNNNNLNESIPDQIAELVELENLDVGTNGLSGSIPADIGNLVNLTDFNIESNEITGPIPDSLGLCIELAVIEAESNTLTGPLPSSLSGLKSITSLNLAGNKLSGVVPSELSILTETLNNIWLDRNDFTGGMDTFCEGDKKVDLFYSDCLPSAFPTTEAEVECSCCTICCTDNAARDSSTCMPRTTRI